MNKEEFDILVNDILKIPQPKEELPVSAMDSINIEELRQVIEAFNKIPDYNLLIKDNLKKDKEIERLNNIINKLEKRLINDKKFFEDVYKRSYLSKEEFRKQCPYTIGSYDYSVEMLGKLQELKGEGSNE